MKVRKLSSALAEAEQDWVCGGCCKNVPLVPYCLELESNGSGKGQLVNVSQ
jgi:hypothetical protein